MDGAGQDIWDGDASFKLSLILGDNISSTHQRTSTYMSICLTMQNAMDVMGMSMDDKDSVLGLVAGILHLGNISFTENGNYAEIEDQGCKT